jgi:hypothetical protein
MVLHMNKRILWTGVLIGLCSETWADSGPVKSGEGVKASGETVCLSGESPEAPWQIARMDDLLSDTEEWIFSRTRPPDCPAVLMMDLDGDGVTDLAQLEVSRAERRARLRFLRGEGGGEYEALTVRTWPALSKGSGSLATWFFPKPAGQPVMRDYLEPSQREPLAQRGAIEVCEPPGGPEAVLTEAADLRCYCSTWLWIEGDSVGSTTVCD